MQITLNGENRDVSEAASLVDVLETLKLPPDARGVAIALEGAVVPRGAWPDVRLEPGQRVEVLTAAQGG
jgi:sulfur carrier protein